MNPIQSKIHSFSKKIATALKISYIAMGIVAFLAVIALSILTFSGSSIRDSFLTAFHITVEKNILHPLTQQELSILYLLLLVYAVIMGAILFIIRKIFLEISKDETPFLTKHTHRIKTVAILAIIISILDATGDSLGELFTMGESTWYPPFTGIIFGIIIYCAAFIFDYGCELQKQSDETL